MTDDEIDAAVVAIAADLTDRSGFGTPAYRKQFNEYVKAEVQKIIAKVTCHQRSPSLGPNVDAPYR